MKNIKLLAALSVAALGMGSAQAATITFTIQNQITTGSISPLRLNTCGAIIPSLGSVPPNSISVAHQTNCGNNTAVAFDYSDGIKTCSFNLSSLYTPPNPILGTSGYWTPKGTGTQRGTTSATCKATLTSIGTNGNYSWALSIQ
ncbi:hypothetical protein HPC49_41510 [Pyxidicoccus fallax]|uniref:Uncharacterized protein n=1 Tax=Pyxidicoccus fallax TaxID=394095 RepID=A0A848LRT2_9BACT|nr:hypothetical protein [Pyxidicoccus fallax]NMO20379.1 hypothetical protein [Pyxidicoccus fallax]NPC84682.1 hypothetical protein [Pyxidicoccus fallax]